MASRSDITWPAHLDSMCTMDYTSTHPEDSPTLESGKTNQECNQYGAEQSIFNRS